jgi:serine/threonine protein kinase
MNMREPSDPSETPTERPRLRINNRLFGRYVLVRKLGRGGTAEVWLAMDEKIQGPVALKFLPTIFSEKEYLDQLREEASRGLMLTHPHIVHVRNFEHEDSMAAIAMEFVDGETLLNRRLQQPNGVFEPAQLFPWVEQLCGALHYAHTSVRIVHRDLKPCNLMVNQRNELKITDFGISMPVAETMLRTTGRNFDGGTIPYMSPDQLNGRAPKPVQDIYSLGATLYELMTSKPPYFRGEIQMQILDFDRTPPSMAERRLELERTGEPIPQVWEDVIAACLAKDPAGRPQTALEVLERLRPRAAVEPLPPPPAPAAMSKVLMLAAAFAIVALTAVVIFQWIEARRDRNQTLAATSHHAEPEKLALPIATSSPPLPVVAATPAPATPIATLPPIAKEPEFKPSPPTLAEIPAAPEEHPAPAPPPPVIESPAPIPTPTLSAADESARIRDFIHTHLSREKPDASGHRNYDAIINDYDTSVKTDDRPAATQKQILNDLVQYYTQWPLGGETIDGAIKIEPAGELEWNATFRTKVDRWTTTPHKKTRRGTVDISYHLRRIGEDYKISAEHVISRSLK